MEHSIKSTIQQHPADGSHDLSQDGTQDGCAAERASDRFDATDQRQRLRIQRLLQRNGQLSEKLRASEARAEDAERRLKAIKGSVAWRSTRFLRKIGAACNGALAAFAQQMPHVDGSNQKPPTLLFKEQLHARVALVIDYRWPRPDQDSGSLDAINLVDALIDAEFEVIFFADTEGDKSNTYRLALESRGVLCLGAPKAIGLQAFLEAYGDRIQLCVLSRVYAGGNYLEAVQQYCTQAHIIFNPVDLHFLREERQAQMSGDAAAPAAAARTRARELLVFGAADATIVVSTAEQELLERLDPRAHVVHLPLARRIVEPQTRFEDRRGIGFIGSFEHAPNLDAVRFFLAEIWPLVQELVPGCEFSIAGKGLGEDFLGRLGPKVRYVGHVPDIETWLETVRLTVAPLRFGAGAKGKIASSLACGVPCVATAMAVEGMGLREGGGVLVADTPEGFAERVRLAHTDATLWRQLSEAGLGHAREVLSLANYRRGVAGMLETMGLALRAPEIDHLGEIRLDPFRRPAQTVCPCHVRTPPQLPTDEPDVEDVDRDIGHAGGLALHKHLGLPAQATNVGRDLADAAAGPRANVKYAVRALIGRGCEQRVDGVFDVQKITHDLPIAPDL